MNFFDVFITVCKLAVGIVIIVRLVEVFIELK